MTAVPDTAATDVIISQMSVLFNIAAGISAPFFCLAAAIEAALDVEQIIINADYILCVILRN